MDIHMPVLSGIDATREIRKQEGQLMMRPAIIIAVTGADVDKTNHQAGYLEYGFSDILPKPISKKDFQAVLEQHVQLQ